MAQCARGDRSEVSRDLGDEVPVQDSARRPRSARELLRQICVAREVTIIRGVVSPDHIPMLVAAPPQLSPSKLVQFLKGRSSRLLQREFPAFAQAVLGAASVGARVLRCECRGGGRTNDPGVYRESTVGRGCRGLHDHRPDRALSRRGSRCLQAASAAARLSVDLESTAFRR